MICYVDFAESRSDVCDGDDDDDGDFFPEKFARSSIRDPKSVCFLGCDLWNDDGGDCYCHHVCRRFREHGDDGVDGDYGGAMTDVVVMVDPTGCLWVSLKTKLESLRTTEYVPYGQVPGSRMAYCELE